MKVSYSSMVNKTYGEYKMRTKLMLVLVVVFMFMGVRNAQTRIRFIQEQISGVNIIGNLKPEYLNEDTIANLWYDKKTGKKHLIIALYITDDKLIESKDKYRYWMGCLTYVSNSNIDQGIYEREFRYDETTEVLENIPLEHVYPSKGRYYQKGDWVYFHTVIENAENLTHVKRVIFFFSSKTYTSKELENPELFNTMVMHNATLELKYGGERKLDIMANDLGWQISWDTIKDTE